MLTAQFSEANQAWITFFGDSPCEIEGQRFWTDLKDLRWTLNTLGLKLVWKARGHYRIVLKANNQTPAFNALRTSYEQKEAEAWNERARELEAARGWNHDIDPDAMDPGDWQ